MKKTLGQYFTTSEELQTFIFEKVQHKGECLLEPSFGAGHLLKKFKEYDENYPMVCYEIDETISRVVSSNPKQYFLYCDFIIQPIQKYKTIIGNPPFVKQKMGNLYLKFIEKCFYSLQEDGELLFIVPSDFIKLTSASSIITNMTSAGSFTDFYFPHNEKLFQGASIDVMVFRYQLGLMTNKTMVNKKEMFCNVNRGIITFSEIEVNGVTVDSLFDVYVGIVSGKDKVYRSSIGNIDVLVDKEKNEKFIFPESFPTNNKEINNHLQKHKSELLERKIKDFNEENWFEWGAPRNMTSIQNLWGKPCIYLRNITRQKEVAFRGTVQYFGGTLLCLVPKNSVNIDDIISHFNSEEFQRDYIYSNRFKIGHKQVSSVIIKKCHFP
uniref:site-specific DNA-methyltransferase (adenine-specific) n=1 Tax=viral metagenome TaxID=1070528 RepID=A0A6C0HT54_9ZZZZ